MSVQHVAAGMSVVEQAVKKAADATGVDFDFLMRTAKRESGYDSSAHASTSSAAGLFQFTEQTWLRTMKRHGSAHGYARYAALIQETGDGRYVVQGEDARKAVMDLRYDAHASAVMAGELASDHAAYLRGRTGREPTGGELYAAHFLGPQGSARLIEARGAQPQQTAANLFPDAAAANRNVFYSNGRPLTVNELYNNLSRTGGGDSTVARLTTSHEEQGQAAFVTYASAARSEHQREQQALMSFIMGGSSDRSPVGSIFSSEMIALMAKERDKSRR
jgi:hypothetical protein